MIWKILAVLSGLFGSLDKLVENLETKQDSEVEK